MPADDKAKSLSVSMASDLWDFVETFVETRVTRSSYFQKLVTADMAKNAAGAPYSRILGDPTSVPKAAEDRFEQRLSRIEESIANLVDTLSASHRRR
jgi:hypothetical protein